MERTHVISFYRHGNTGKDASGARTTGWTAVASNVDANLQPLSGSVRPSAAGREVDAQVQAFIPAGITIEPDMGVALESGTPPVGPAATRFRVVEVGAQGDGWDTELLLRTTAEVIP